MQINERSPADVAHAPRSNHVDPYSKVQLSANMTCRLENLAPWRIDPPLIEFPKGGPKFEGGYATVSRGYLTFSPDDTKDRVGEPKVGSLTSSNSPSKSGGGDERREAEGSDEEGRNRREFAFDRQEQELDGETSGRRKAVAVKQMRMRAQYDVVRVLGLMIREAEFLVGLSHENIIELQGFVQDLSKNTIWLVFPWEDNGTLKDFIASAEWEIPERISLLHDVARGVEYLHGRKPPICHGDLKSVNVLVNSECRAVITDFGSARHHTTKGPKRERERVENDPQTVASPETTFCPSTNTITLTCNQYTLRWAAPELLVEDDASLASDVWALGCVAYEVMTNSIPFQDVKDYIVVERVVRGDLPSISSNARMALIQALCTLVRQCWNIDPSKRPSAEGCQGAIAWMPMIIPNPVRTTSAPELAGRSAKLLMQLGRMHQGQSDYSSASKYYAEALNLYASIADRNGEANALLDLAQVHRCRNEYNLAVAFYSDALDIHTDIGNGLGRAIALYGLATVHRFRNEHDLAVVFYSGALKIYTDIGNRLGRAAAVWGLADVHRRRNEYSQAVTFYSECLQIYADIGDQHGRASALSGLAEVHRLRNEDSQAITFYRDCLQIRTDIGDRQGRAEALWGLAEVHRRRNEQSQAVRFYSECLQIRTDIGDRFGRAEALWGLAEVHRRRTEYSQAVALFSEALEISVDVGSVSLKAFVLLSIAYTYRIQAHYGNAIGYYEQAAKAFQQVGRHDAESFAREEAADARRLLEEKEAAQRSAEEIRD